MIAWQEVQKAFSDRELTTTGAEARIIFLAYAALKRRSSTVGQVFNTARLVSTTGVQHG